jgi:hypothetical protein
MQRTLAIAITLAFASALFAANASFAADDPVDLSETSSMQAAPVPTPTYVSELGPASVRPPRQAIELPLSGSQGAPRGIAWSKSAGIALLLAGVLMVQGGRFLRAHTAS